MLPRVLAAFLLLIAAWSAHAHALTARDLGGRLQIDGFTSDYAADEIVFGFNEARNLPEELRTDSPWGTENEIRQIRITWDASYLYVAVEGIINGNNVILLLDTVRGRGLSTMRQLNSWQRLFDFPSEFAPDLFGATWDNNSTGPRLLVHQGGLQVEEHLVSSGVFRGASTFYQSQRRRAMELAIPWNTLFLGTEGLGTRDTVLPGSPDTLRLFAPGTTIRLAAVVTGGGDNTGGPDSAPDNTRGHGVDGSSLVLVDNFAEIDLDLNDDTGLGQGGPDGVADWNVDPSTRVRFRYEPPIPPLRFDVDALTLDRPAIAPHLGHEVRFRFELTPPPDPADLINRTRTVFLYADVYDVRGKFVRTLYANDERPVLTPLDPARDRWDGRDQFGQRVPPGIYIVRLRLERAITRPVAVAG